MWELKISQKKTFSDGFRMDQEIKFESRTINNLLSLVNAMSGADPADETTFTITKKVEEEEE